MNSKINILFILLFFTSITNCKNEEYKVCINQSPDIKIKLYNELTDQLICNNFFDEYYLGEKKYFDSLRVTSLKNDDEKYDKERVKAHNLLFNNKNKFCVLYIDSVNIKNTDIAEYSNESKINLIERNKHLFKNFSNSINILKNLSLRSSVKANQFNQCTVKVLDIENKSKNEKECEAGIVYFSEIVFDNTKKNALVFVNYRNKQRDFRNYIIKLTLVNDYWQADDEILLAIS